MTLPYDPYAEDPVAARNAMITRTRWFLLLYLVLIAAGIFFGIWVFGEISAPTVLPDQT